MIDLIQAATGKQIVPGKTLLIIDEIQESHKALNALKYFNQEMPELAIIVAGSLLGLSMGKAGDSRKRKERGNCGNWQSLHRCLHGCLSFLSPDLLPNSTFIVGGGCLSMGEPSTLPSRTC